MQEEQEPVTDAYLEDYEEFLEDDERWRPCAGPMTDIRDRNGSARRRKGMRI